MAMTRGLGEWVSRAIPEGISLCAKPERTGRDLMRLVAGTCEAIPEEGSLMLACESPFIFAASLIACWRRGLLPVIAPDTQPGTLAQLAPSIRAVVCESVLTDVPVPIIHPRLSDAVPPVRTIRAEEPALDLFTSGSTGERKRITKTFSQLDSEIAVLDRVWGNENRYASRLATVSHLHIYGLLFRLLWPMCAGSPFVDRTFFYWEELFGELKDSAVIVSSPAHLRHFADAARDFERDWSTIRVFSSGGPLPRSVALSIARVHGRAPTEVLGSTETGGIAFREQKEETDSPWRPLPDVSYRIAEGLLEVRSPFLAQSDLWTGTGDKARAALDGRFFLEGRADRIVKLSEKRISLNEMETRVCQHPWVAESKAVLLPVRSDRDRPFLGMVATLTEAGRQDFRDLGKIDFQKQVRFHLSRFFEAVTLPRLWRFPDELPCNAQGKITVSSLAALFRERDPVSGQDDTARPERQTGLEVLDVRKTDTDALIHCRVPEDLFYLHGHFPEIAVVAGVCQLKWVQDAIRTHFGVDLSLCGMEAVKFHHLLFPGELFDMEIRLLGRTEKWAYRLFRGDRKFASGRLLSEKPAETVSG